MQDLLSATDPDWTAYTNGDPAYLLQATGAVIRNFCGWHIYPSITECIDKLEIGSKGLIMVPSLHITDVKEVAIRPSPQDEPTILDPSAYIWFQQGWIEPTGNPFWGLNWWTGYYYEPGPTFLPVVNPGHATVTLTHGYDVLPADVKEVAFELALWTQEMRTGNIKEIASPGFRLMLGQSMGMSLTPDQKNRLRNYAIGAVK